MENIDIAVKIAEKVDKQGGRAYFVGGYVRDMLLGIDSKDIDMEIHGIYPDDLKLILAEAGKVTVYGKSFGIYSLRGHNIDVAVPRKEKNTGRGHRDFEVFTDPFIGEEKAALRRDFTINALMKDVLTGEVIDFFGGMRDLKKGIIRHVNDQSFAEDPLRVLRACGFAARFCFDIAPETISLCRTMDLTALPAERIEEELKKALLKGKRPSLFFEYLRRMEQLDVWFPEVKALIGVPQDVSFHPEGDVWNHTMIVLDRGALLRDMAEEPYPYMLTVLMHDLGKTNTTEFIKGKYHAYGHENDVSAAESLLNRLGAANAVKRYCRNMIPLHMKPHIISNDRSSVKASNRMFDKAVSKTDLLLLTAADGISKDRFDFLAERLTVYDEMMSRPYVTGTDLINPGFKPGEDFKNMLEYAHKLRLAGVSREDVVRQIVSAGKKRKDE